MVDTALVPPAVTPSAGRKLRLAHVTATFPPYRGGTGNVVWHLTRELAMRGHDVHVLTARSGGGARVANPEGVTVHRLRPLVRVGNVPVLPELLPKLRGFDLIHLHYPFFFGAELVWAAARAFRIPYVLTYHNDVRLTGALAPAPAIYRRIVGNRILSEADKILFTTLDYARLSDAATFANSAKAAELPLGVDIERFSDVPSDINVRQRLNIRRDRVLLLFVAALDRPHYFKGLPVLLKAASQLSVELLVVGDGDLRPSYERQACKLGLRDRVHFAGSVSDTDLAHMYAASDVLVLPSVTRGEAFGLVLLEAMASEKPVIASDLPGVRAVVRKTGGGLLVPPGSTIRLAERISELATDPARRLELGRKGRQAIEEQFTWSMIGNRLEQIYASAANGA